MHAVDCGERELADFDVGRLTQVADAAGSARLAELVDEADVLPARRVPDDLATMLAQVELEHLPARRRQVVVLCYPGEAQPDAGHISVLSPVGLAVIGLRAGATAVWHSPSGGRCEARVVGVRRAAHAVEPVDAAA